MFFEMNKSVDVLLKLLRVALGVESDFSLPCNVAWEEVYHLSLRQGVGAVACDGLLAIKDNSVEEALKYKWMGQSMVIEQKYYRQKQSIAELASFYHQHGINMMLLKGYGLSLNYPVPEHRPAGDIDVFLFGDKTKADGYVERDLKIKVKTSYDKHSSFVFKGATVENHDVFFDLHSHPSNKVVNDYIYQIIGGRTEAIEIQGSYFVIPNPTLMAIHLLRHTACDFAANSISLRQVMDWSTLVSKRGGEMEWPLIMSFVEKTGMSRFFQLISAFSIERLGLQKDSFPLVIEEHVDLEPFVLDIICGKRVSDFPDSSRKLSYGIRKSLQFWQNRWKYKMVYKDNLFDLYFSIAKNRLIH